MFLLRVLLFCFFCIGFLFSPALFAKAPVCNLKDPRTLAVLAKEKADQAQRSSDIQEKARLAKQGIEFAEKCLQLDLQNIDCVYVRAVNRGLYMETQSFGLKNDAKLLLQDFEFVAKQSPAHDEGGAYLALAQFFLKAPKMPILGEGHTRDLSKALVYADQAIAFGPQAFENHQTKAEILYKQKNYKEAAQSFKTALRLIKKVPGADKEKKHIEKMLKRARKK